jgi:hypothetical protein
VVRLIFIFSQLFCSKFALDFDNTDDEEEDWNDQVPPDEEEFNEIEDDDFSAHTDY